MMCDYKSDDDTRSTTSSFGDGNNVENGYDTEEEWAPNPHQADADAHYFELMRRSSESQSLDDQEVTSVFSQSPREQVNQVPKFPRRFRTAYPASGLAAELANLSPQHDPMMGFNVNPCGSEFPISPQLTPVSFGPSGFEQPSGAGHGLPFAPSSFEQPAGSFGACSLAKPPGSFAPSSFEQAWSYENSHQVAQASANDRNGKARNRQNARQGMAQETVCLDSHMPLPTPVTPGKQASSSMAGAASKSCLKEHLLRLLARDDGVPLQDCFKDCNADALRSVTHGMMQNFAKEGDTYKAGRCADLVLSLGASSTLMRTFNLVLSTCSKTGSLSEARYWWDRFVSAGLKPTLITYNTMVNVCGRSKDVNQAECWMQSMLREGVKPCLVSFTTLISACGHAGYVSKAEYWFEQTQVYGLRPDVALHNAMIDTYVKNKDVQKAEWCFFKMQRDGVMPCQRTYNMMIYVCAKTGNMERAQNWYHEMQKSNFSCDLYTYGSLIEGCTKYGNMDLVEEILGNMFMDKLTPNLVCLRSLLKVYAPSQNYFRLADTLKWCMQDGGVSKHLVHEVVSATEARFTSSALQQLLVEPSNSYKAHTFEGNRQRGAKVHKQRRHNMRNQHIAV
eukprot:TRINITY_DN3972_c0_g1_i2.p1 TRINITY_DN3972_c0_g1~~TRINITY_DN3972_c0_g1_i2.p1  ORF type:complete len:639 (-),score=130.30 TRINITY_DN3972_c0_g1_i2:159-2015(-)